MKIYFFGIISCIFGGIIVEDDLEREFGDSMDLLFFEMVFCTFEGLITP